MKLRDLVVVTDSSKASDDRLELAASLAAEHDAFLVGVYVLPLPEPEPSEKSTIVGQIIMSCIHEEQKHAREVHRKFETALSQHGVNGEWRTPGGIAREEAAIQARYADLVIVGQVDPALKRGVIPPLCPEDVAISAGRPVLVAPVSWRQSKVGRRILIAWNARREATRAVHDALPLLISAECVTVLVANPETWVVPPHGQEPGADIALHLSRHGVRAQVDVVVAHGTKTGEIVRAKARDLSADLIVMGAYGHSRARELVLGGVTRYMLREMPVPVLLSH